MNLTYSIIIAVYNRADMLEELLQSLTNQNYREFDVVVVDDGSQEDLSDTISKFREKLNLSYFYKENTGPGQTRNYGMARAKGNYFIFLDSDVLVPKAYMEQVNHNLKSNYVDAFGGADTASNDFSSLQKAISFAMTSILTTGGIRGGKERLGKFQPRSFNMGISKKAYEATGGFGDLRIGEDPDLSMRLWKKGFKTALFANCTVYHKRRSTLKSFAKQVYEFGVARPILDQRHPNFTKVVFWLPSLFFLGSVIALVSLFFIPLSGFFAAPALLLSFFFVLIFIGSGIQFRSFKSAFLAVLACAVQLYGYGFGFLKAQFYLHILGQKAKSAFPHHFTQG